VHWQSAAAAPGYGHQQQYGSGGAGPLQPSHLRIPSAGELDAGGGHQRYGPHQPSLSPSKRQRATPGIVAPGLAGPSSRAGGGGVAQLQAGIAGQVLHSSQLGDGLPPSGSQPLGAQQQRQPGQRPGARTAAQRHAAKLQAAIESQRAAVAGVMRARVGYGMEGVLSLCRSWLPSIASSAHCARGRTPVLSMLDNV
jgi:hypothetical protein